MSQPIDYLLIVIGIKAPSTSYNSSDHRTLNAMNPLRVTLHNHQYLAINPSPMGIVHQKPRQQNFAFAQSKSEHRFSHGGVLFQKRSGRKERPLSSREPLHLVFKARKERLKSGSLRSSQNFRLIHEILRKYAKRFFVKVEQVSVQGDHLHLLIRTSRRSHFHFFFRVVAGQIAQRFEQEGRLRVPPKKEASLNARSHEGSLTATLDEGSLNAKSDEKSLKSLPPNKECFKALPTNKKYLKAPPFIEESLKALPHCESLRVPSIKSRSVSDTPAPGTRLWRYRPFTRVVRGWRAYRIVRDYIRLNEKEIQGEIPYRKERLKGLSSADWEILWV